MPDKAICPHFGEREPVANDEHLALLHRGPGVWNDWRIQTSKLIKPDLNGATLNDAKLSYYDLSLAVLTSAHLTGANLSGSNLYGADLASANLGDAELSTAILSRANLVGADLHRATLNSAHLVGAILRDADLAFARLFQANLSGADLCKADLSGADLRRAVLAGADLSSAILVDTTFGAVDLTRTKGLDDCVHNGPSSIDFRTLHISKDLPLSFLRGCGLPDTLIDYLPSLRGDAIQFYSCFISYSTKDLAFADRLHADLQNKGVRCWFAPHDLPIGAKTWDAIDEAICLRDKLLLILSKASIASEWVEDEVNKAYAEERSRKETVLFPIRIDNAVISTGEPWAVKLRDQRNIGDFRQWKKPAEYQKSLDLLLRDLKASGEK
jgi:uncharacterized protein YjbI with pentapeptide repeats